MLVVPWLENRESLRLDGYSHDSSELEALGAVVRESGGASDYEALRRDEGGCPGRRYFVLDDAVASFELRLGIRFSGSRSRTWVVVEKGGQGYRCREIRQMGDGAGCEDIDAADQRTAVVKCALIAGRNGWFGGVAQRGRC